MSADYRFTAHGFVVLLALVLAGPAEAQDSDSSEESGIEYRLLGPINGGRASRVVGIPGEIGRAHV